MPPQATYRFRGTKQRLIESIKAIGPALSGSGPDPDGAAGEVLLVGGMALLDRIWQDFAAKSVGAADAMGVTWAPLAPATVQRKQQQSGRYVTPTQIGVFKGPLLDSLEPAERGAPEYLRGRARPVNADQILELGGRSDRLKVGSRHPHFDALQKGGPRTPRRKIIPDPQEPLPASWANTLVETIREGLKDPEFWRHFLGL